MRHPGQKGWERVEMGLRAVTVTVALKAPNWSFFMWLGKSEKQCLWSWSVCVPGLGVSWASWEDPSKSRHQVFLCLGAMDTQQVKEWLSSHSHLQVCLQQGIHFLDSHTILLSLKLCVSNISLPSPQLIFEGWKKENARSFTIVFFHITFQISLFLENLICFYLSRWFQLHMKADSHGLAVRATLSQQCWLIADYVKMLH